jgi:transcriptional regulator with XRE-family HTH domain
MIYNKIRKTIEENNFKIKAFFKSCGFSDSFIYKAESADSLKVKDLEIISKKLGKPMSYWFEEEKNVLMEQKIEYEKTHKKTVDELTDTISYFKHKCEKLEKENEDLKYDCDQKAKKTG